MSQSLESHREKTSKAKKVMRDIDLSKLTKHELPEYKMTVYLRPDQSLKSLLERLESRKYNNGKLGI